MTDAANRSKERSEDFFKKLDWVKTHLPKDAASSLSSYELADLEIKAIQAACELGSLRALISIHDRLGNIEDLLRHSGGVPVASAPVAPSNGSVISQAAVASDF